VVEAAAEAHPDCGGVLLLADRLAKGINFKSGSCLKDLSDLAHELFVTLKDADGSLAVADLLNVLPYDGNPGRWASVEASLALSSYICRQNGQEERAEVYEKLIRTPENQETDAFKARMAGQGPAALAQRTQPVRQRNLPVHRQLQPRRRAGMAAPAARIPAVPAGARRLGNHRSG
jgi:hypothetical protein